MPGLLGATSWSRQNPTSGATHQRQDSHPTGSTQVSPPMGSTQPCSRGGVPTHAWVGTQCIQLCCGHCKWVGFEDRRHPPRSHLTLSWQSDRSGVPWSLLVSDVDHTAAMLFMTAGQVWLGGPPPDWWGQQDSQAQQAVQTNANNLFKKQLALLPARVPEEDLGPYAQPRADRTGPYIWEQGRPLALWYPVVAVERLPFWFWAVMAVTATGRMIPVPLVPIEKRPSVTAALQHFVGMSRHSTQCHRLGYCRGWSRLRTSQQVQRGSKLPSCCKSRRGVEKEL